MSMTGSWQSTSHAGVAGLRQILRQLHRCGGRPVQLIGPGEGDRPVRPLLEEQEELSRLVELDEIARNDHSLNIPLYVAGAPEEETLSLDEALAQLEKAHADVRDSRANLESELAKWGL